MPNVNTLLLRQLDEADSYYRSLCMIITDNYGSESPSEESGLNVISAAVKEAGIDEKDFKKHVDKIHPIGCAKKQKPSKNYKIYFT